MKKYNQFKNEEVEKPSKVKVKVYTYLDVWCSGSQYDGSSYVQTYSTFDEAYKEMVAGKKEAIEMLGHYYNTDEIEVTDEHICPTEWTAEVNAANQSDYWYGQITETELEIEL